MVVEKEKYALRIPKIYYFFPSLRYFNFSKDVFKRKFQKMTKTVNLNVRVQRISPTSVSDIIDNAWECANKYVA